MENTAENTIINAAVVPATPISFDTPEVASILNVSGDEISEIAGLQSQVSDLELENEQIEKSYNDEVADHQETFRRAINADAALVYISKMITDSYLRGTIPAKITAVIDAAVARHGAKSFEIN